LGWKNNRLAAAETIQLSPSSDGHRRINARAGAAGSWAGLAWRPTGARLCADVLGQLINLVDAAKRTVSATVKARRAYSCLPSRDGD
jgi:hypothetical protein